MWKSILIIWHRRRAAHWNARKHLFGTWNHDVEWRDWHLEQIKRLEGK